MPKFKTHGFIRLKSFFTSPNG